MIAQRGRIERCRDGRPLNSRGSAWLAVAAGGHRPGAGGILEPARHLSCWTLGLSVAKGKKRPASRARGPAPGLRRSGGGSAPPFVLVGPGFLGEPVVHWVGFPRLEPASSCGADRHQSAESCTSLEQPGLLCLCPAAAQNPSRNGAPEVQAVRSVCCYCPGITLRAPPRSAGRPGALKVNIIVCRPAVAPTASRPRP